MDFTINIDRADLNTSKSKGASCQHFVQSKLMTSYPRLFFQILSKIWPTERLTHYVFHYTDGYATVIHVNWSAVGVPGFVRLPLVSAYLDVNITLRPRGDCEELQSNNNIMGRSSGIMDLHFSAVTPSFQPFVYNLAHMSVLHVNELDRYPAIVGSFRIIEGNGYDYLPETVRMHSDPVDFSSDNDVTGSSINTDCAEIVKTKRKRKHEDKKSEDHKKSKEKKRRGEESEAKEERVEVIVRGESPPTESAADSESSFGSVPDDDETETFEADTDGDGDFAHEEEEEEEESGSFNIEHDAVTSAVFDDDAKYKEESNSQHVEREDFSDDEVQIKEKQLEKTEEELLRHCQSGIRQKDKGRKVLVIDVRDVPYQTPIKRSTKNGSSKYQGVSFVKSRKKWVARIEIDGKRHHIGYYDDEERAAVEYARAVFKYDAGERIRGPKFINLTGVPDQSPIKSSVEGGSSKYQGVYFCKKGKKWIAQIRIDGKLHHIGYYDDEERAGIDYARADFKYRRR